MCQYFPQQPARQMPHVARPHPLDREALAQLTEDRLDAIANAANSMAPLRFRVPTRFLERHQHLDTPRTQLRVQIGFPVVAIRQTTALSLLGQLFEHGQVSDIRRTDRKARDDSRPSDPHMKAKAVEGLLDRMVTSEARLGAKTAAPRRASKAADRDREAINECPTGVAARPLKQLLPESFFDSPEVGRLTDKARPMQLCERREEAQVVAAKVVEDRRVTVHAEVFTDDFDGQHLRVAQQGARPALAQARWCYALGQTIVNETEDSYNERVQVHKAPAKRES
jgi:hypothetical protein